MSKYKTEIIVQLTEDGKAQVLTPYMGEPRTLKPGEQLRFRIALDLSEPEQRTAVDWLGADAEADDE